jgi:hypothetical protein
MVGGITFRDFALARKLKVIGVMAVEFVLFFAATGSLITAVLAAIMGITMYWWIGGIEGWGAWKDVGIQIGLLVIIAIFHLVVLSGASHMFALINDGIIICVTAGIAATASTSY